MIQFFKTILGFFVPGGVLFFAAVILISKGYLAPWLPQITGTLPYIVMATGLLLGLRFHHSRLAFGILIIFFTERSLFYFGPGGQINGNHATNLLYCLSVFLPINILLLSFSRDRGILNSAGVARLIFLLSQALGIYYLIRERPDLLQHLKSPLIPLQSMKNFAIPQGIIAGYGLVILLLFILSLQNRRSTVKGFFWAMLTSAIPFYFFYSGKNEAIYFSVASLIVVVSMLETAYAMAYNDELTGLPARRALNNSMQNLGGRYTIAMLDIDFFKKFNDKYGHDVGDQVLCMVASHINRVGGGGRPFRYGGEEFTVVFPGKSKKAARPHLERLRESIANARFKVRGKNRPKRTPKKKRRVKNPKTVSVTISIGAAEPARNIGKPSEVLKAADKALYRAKKKGRNCTVT